MTLQEQVNQYRNELINNQSQQYELVQRHKELIVIVQALELGAKREEELLSKSNGSVKE